MSERTPPGSGDATAPPADPHPADAGPPDGDGTVGGNRRAGRAHPGGDEVRRGAAVTGPDASVNGGRARIGDGDARIGDGGQALIGDGMAGPGAAPIGGTPSGPGSPQTRDADALGAPAGADSPLSGDADALGAPAGADLPSTSDADALGTPAGADSPSMRDDDAVGSADAPAAAGAPSTSDADALDSANAAGGDGASGAPVDDEHARSVRHWREKSRKRNSKKRSFWIELPILIVIAFILTFLIQTFIARVYYVPSGSMEQTLHGTTSGGDRILAFKLVYDFRDPEQGEVVVFKGPDTWAPEADIPGPSNWFGQAMQALGSVVGIAPPNEKDFVKRVIAVGGQTVSCCDAQGRVQVDGVSLVEPYIYQPIDAERWAQPGFHCQADPAEPTRYNSRRCFAPFTVPQGELWVMGDHRSDSSDSSYYCQGLTEKGVQQYQQSRTDHSACARPIPVDDVIGKAVFIVMPPSRWGTVGSPDIMSGGG
jgi:signal peptidase I